jgi:hypothetical protein
LIISVFSASDIVHKPLSLFSLVQYHSRSAVLYYSTVYSISLNNMPNKQPNNAQEIELCCLRSGLDARKSYS